MKTAQMKSAAKTEKIVDEAGSLSGEPLPCGCPGTAMKAFNRDRYDKKTRTVEAGSKTVQNGEVSPELVLSAQAKYRPRRVLGCSRRPSAVPAIPAAPASSPGRNSHSMAPPCSVSRCCTNIDVK